MKKLLINVFAFIGICVIAGLLYWIGVFHGDASSAERFRALCNKDGVGATIRFEGDPSVYICLAPPKHEKQEVPTLQFGSIQKRIEEAT